MMKSIFVVLAIVVAAGTAQAGCNPCICGPGGGYRGDIQDWIRRNCKGTGRPGDARKPNVAPLTPTGKN